MFQGWFITYIDRDPEALAAEEKKAKKQKMDKDDEERMMDFIVKQVEKGQNENQVASEDTATPLIRSEDDGPLVIDMKLKPKPSTLMGPPLRPLKKVDCSKKIIKEEPLDSDELLILEKDDSRIRDPSESRNSHHNSRGDDDSSSKKGKRERRDSNEHEDESSKSEGWLRENLVVKIMTKSLGEKYYKAKGVVKHPVLESGFVGKIKIMSPKEVEGHVIKIDQEHLETVIPAIGKDVVIVQGKYKGCKATLEKVRIEEYSVDVELLKEKKYVKRLPYEHICKYID